MKTYSVLARDNSASLGLFKAQNQDNVGLHCLWIGAWILIEPGIKSLNYYYT